MLVTLLASSSGETATRATDDQRSGLSRVTAIKRMLNAAKAQHARLIASGREAFSS
jgi:hypothetical protein